MRALLSTSIGLLLTVALATPAIALPGTTADAGVYMVDGPVVHDVVVVAGKAWIGGRFSNVLNGSGSQVASATGLTVFNGDGTLAASLHSALPALTGSSAKVYDMSLGPNGILYVAGTFGYSFGGKSYKNLVGIDPATGSVVAAYNAIGLRAVLATSDYVYAGGTSLQRYALSGGAASGSWHAMRAYIDSSLRGHSTAAIFREIEQISSSTLLVVGQFDWIDVKDAAHEKKVAVKVDVATGEPELGPESWAVDCTCADQNTAAFGLAIETADGIAYVAAGGNDWMGAFRISDGSRLWQTDVNGSAQEITLYDGSTLVVGGHWTSIEDDGAGDQGGNECPARSAASQEPCWLQPRLAAISRTTGFPDASWAPNVCCLYRGVWALAVEGSMVHVGGEFTKLDGESGPERYYGRYS